MSPKIRIKTIVSNIKDMDNKYKGPHEYIHV